MAVMRLLGLQARERATMVTFPGNRDCPFSYINGKNKRK